MKIEVFGLVYKVVKAKVLSTGGVANCDYKKKLIQIRSDMVGQKSDECLLHEIGHAVIDRVGGGSTKLPPDLEEIIVDSIAKVVSENFKLVRRR